MNLGIVQNSLKKFDEAELSYWNGIKFRKKYPDCYYNLGRLVSDVFSVTFETNIITLWSVYEKICRETKSLVHFLRAVLWTFILSGRNQNGAIYY